MPFIICFFQPILTILGDDVQIHSSSYTNHSDLISNYSENLFIHFLLLSIPTVISLLRNVHSSSYCQKTLKLKSSLCLLLLEKTTTPVASRQLKFFYDLNSSSPNHFPLVGCFILYTFDLIYIIFILHFISFALLVTTFQNVYQVFQFKQINHHVQSPSEALHYSGNLCR